MANQPYEDSRHYTDDDIVQMIKKLNPQAAHTSSPSEKTEQQTPAFSEAYLIRCKELDLKAKEKELDTSLIARYIGTGDNLKVFVIWSISVMLVCVLLLSTWLPRTDIALAIVPVLGTLAGYIAGTRDRPS